MTAKKPADLLFGVEDRPPRWMTLIQSFQHICIYAISLLFPVLIVRAYGGTVDEAGFLVSMSLFAGGIGVMVQALSRGPMGSGYLCPQVCGPSFLTASILAARTGGLSLLLGMTLVAGAFEAFFSRFIQRLRFLFPVEVTGLIVALVGITVIQFAGLNFLGLDGALDTVSEAREVVTSLVTLGIMVGLNVWSKGKLKLFCVLIGMTAGYVLAWSTGLITPEQAAEVQTAPLLWFPFSHHPGWSFNGFLVVPFLVAMVCSSLKTVGDLTTCQKINDEAWKRPDLANISRGLLADAAGCVTAGAVGGMGQSSSSTNIGLSIATGTTSRVIAYPMGALMLLLAFFPKISALFAIIPKPVIGATLVFSLAFMVIAGFQIIMSRMIDSRKTFVVGLSLIFGLTVDVIPEFFSHVHPWLQPVFSSSLSTGTLSALVLNLIFRIGIAKKVSIELPPDEGAFEALPRFMEENGKAWGARREVIARASAALHEGMEALLSHHLAKGPVKVRAAFDEFKLDIEVEYPGSALELPAAEPDLSRLLEDREEQLRFSGVLVTRLADKARVSVKGDHSIVRMHFDH